MDYNDEKDKKDPDKVEEAVPKYQPLMTPHAYIEWEESRKEKSEYIKGEIFTMQGATLDHNEIFSNLMENIPGFLKGKKCRMYASDMRIFIESEQSFLYPDATIFCDGIKGSEEYRHSATNPSAIFEILSPSTAQHDLKVKLAIYMQIESLKEYITIYSRKMEVHMRRKKTDGTWEYGEIRLPEDNLLIQTINFTIPLKELYERIEFKSSPLKRID